MDVKTVSFSVDVLFNMYDINTHILRRLVLAVITDQEKAAPWCTYQNIKLAITIEMYFVELIFCPFREIQR